MNFINPGFDPETVAQLKAELQETGMSFKIIPDEENSEEYVNFYFVGTYEGKEVIYDTALYTLRLHHASEVYELAEHEAAKKCPNFKAINYDEEENGNLKPLTPEEEEIGWFITELIMEIEEEETVKVLNEKPWHKEGFENLEWVLLDYIDVVAHVFQREKRDFYAIEELWGDATEITFKGK
jgi:hypothetical protein